MSALRTVKQIVKTVTVMEGAGFPVKRPFPVRGLQQFDPFLLFDHFDKDWAPGEAVGAPNHPHRGFETVSYILRGEMRHKDSVGNTGLLRPGDVQWMTAGSGIVHDEGPTPDQKARGGRSTGFQIWVNLPRKDKMIHPRYQDIPSAKIPVAHTPDGLVDVKVIAGETLGVKAVIDTRTPIMYLHYIIRPGGSAELDVDSRYNVMAYVFEGRAKFDQSPKMADTFDTVFFSGTPLAVFVFFLFVCDSFVPHVITLCVCLPLSSLHLVQTATASSCLCPRRRARPRRFCCLPACRCVSPWSATGPSS